MLTKIPKFIRSFFPNRLWKVATEEKVVYLTFDDGPIPEVTPWVLEQLKKYNAGATFFCIGDNIRKHPEIFHQVLSEGHRVGNHTFTHLNGWRTSADVYLRNALSAEKLIIEETKKTSEESEKREVERSNKGVAHIAQDVTTKGPTTSKRLFRPPYGRITRKQARLLTNENHRIVMWDILSRDYNRKLSPEKCMEKIITYTEPGSIIVFHDSFKAEKNMKAVLPRVLDYYSSKGYSFGKL